jgi:acetyltransferase
VGGEILRNLKRCGYSGALYAVNPGYDDIDGIPCVPSIEALPEGVDLVVVAVNRRAVLDVAAACGTRGMRNLVIISAGFKEAGVDGARLEEQLRGLIAKHDLTVVGPNCMGLINSAGDVLLNASFSRWFPESGDVAFISQSGSLGETVLELFAEFGLGVSLFANLGNRAGITENDLLAYAAEDPQSRVVFLYLESFADPPGFRELVGSLARSKPVVVLKAGRTEVGAAAVASHTGSLASPDAVVDAFLHQSGAVRVMSIDEALSAIRVLERGIASAGERVAILTNAGGAGIIAADACIRQGMSVPPLPAQVQSVLKMLLPAEASVANPVDMIATANSEAYEKALDTILPAVDAAMVIFRPPLVLDEPPSAVADAIVRAADRHPTVPVVVCTLSRGEAVHAVVHRLSAGRIASFVMPEAAVDALRVLRDLGGLLEPVEREPARSDISLDTVAKVLRHARSEARDGLTFEEGATLLDAYGIDACPFTYLQDDDDGERFADEHGFPLVAKLDAPGLAHRFEQGAVITGIAGHEQLGDAVAQLRALSAEESSAARVLLQPQLSGRELILGVERDPAFGPVVMFGIGGTLVEALQDVAFGVAPLSLQDALRMIRSIRSFPLLEAFRGQPAVDLDRLADALVRLGRLALDHPEIEEIDLNPTIATDTFATAVDILIRLAER